MKLKNLLFAAIGVLIFLLLSKLWPYSNKTSGTVNYAPDGFAKTIAKSLNGKVTKTEQKGLFYVTLNNDTISYPFSFAIEKMPENPSPAYPNDFITVKDSIFKNANSDTFYIVRRSMKWLYVLPR